MKTMTLKEFEVLVASNDWKREQEIEVVERLDRTEEEWNSESETLEQVYIPHVFGWATVTNELEGIKIQYQEGFNYDECDSDSLATSTEGQDDVWSIEGVTVVDEDGDELDAYDLAEYLDGRFSSIDYDVLQIDQTTDIDFDEDSEMETYTLEIDNAPSIRFTGELIGSTSSSPDQAMGSSYSGQTGRWTELELYKTVGGKYICHQVGRTQWQGERDRFSGKVCETLEQVKEFFGHRWLAKELYAEAGIDDVVEVE